MKLKGILIFLLFALNPVTGQGKVAITIDDVPNTKKYEQDDFNARLLEELDFLNIPIAIFINEGMIYKTDNVPANLNLMDQWINREYTTIANHTFSHSRYSDVGLDSFTVDIEKGGRTILELAEIYGKSLDYFRFPYNDLGKDSIEHIRIANYLLGKNYTIAPFTIESSDYMYNYIYNYYLRSNNVEKAEQTANEYINKTLEYFAFFDSISISQYGRRINHIFLCHDNSINADYLPVLIRKLKEQGYSFVDLDEAMEDPAYSQGDIYYKKWGISWIYRWMENTNERKQLMRSEPDIQETYNLYLKLTSESG